MMGSQWIHVMQKPSSQPVDSLALSTAVWPGPSEVSICLADMSKSIENAPQKSTRKRTMHIFVERLRLSFLCNRKISDISCTKSRNLIILVSYCKCLCPVHRKQVSSRAGANRCIWTSAAPTTHEWSTSLLPIKLFLMLKVWRHIFHVSMASGMRIWYYFHHCKYHHLTCLHCCDRLHNGVVPFVMMKVMKKSRIGEHGESNYM